MVAIVSGNSLGLSLGSSAILGQRGQWGAAGQGRSGEQSFINVADGNLVLQGRDDVLIGRGPDVSAVRTYNSQGLLTDDNADNWSVGAFGQKVVLTSGTVDTTGSTLMRTDQDGARALYTWDVTRNGYVSPAGSGAFDTIAYSNGAAQFIWTDGDTGRIERYQSAGAGRLISVTDADGNTVSYAYNANGTVLSVTDANGDITYYDYSGTNLTQLRTVSKSTDGQTNVTLTRVRYAYDSANRLSTVTVDLSPEDNSVTDGKTYLTTYTYDGTSKRIASVARSDGTKLSFTYVQAGGSYKVETVTDALEQVTRFAYNATTSTTTVTDPLGAQSTYLYDADGQLLQMRQGVTAGNPSGLSQVSYRYDAAGNVTGVTDGEGREVAYEYDANGNLLKETDSAGNLHTPTYNAANQLLTDTVYADAAVSRGVFSKEASLAEITRYVYAQGNPRLLRFVVSAQGDVTEHRYDSYGQMLTTIRYTGGGYNVAALGATAVPTEAQMTTWAGSSTQDLRRTERTERTDRVYDARGALSSSTTYGEVDATGAGVAASAAKTQYVYDQHGWLLKSIEPTGGGTTTYVYDGLGRVLSVSAPSLDGGATANTTVTSYDDAGGKTSVSTAAGLVTVSAYDKAGRLVSVTQQSAGTGVLGTTTYAYDKDGNLLMTQDPTGVRKWMLYDEAGRKIADIDATGAVIEYVYNASGQLRQTVAYATRLTVAKLAQLVDEAGLPTTASSATNTTTSLATLRPTGAVQDQKVSRFYDSAGRLAWQVDVLGYVTQTTYDGASRILSVTELAKPIDVAPLILGASVDLGVDPSSLGGATLSVGIAGPTPLGQNVALTATVEGVDSSGMVTFFDGETIIGSSLLIDGKASFVTDKLSMGNHNLRVAYSGDTWRPASVSKAVTKNIAGAATTAEPSFSPSPATYGQAVTLSLAFTTQPKTLAAATGQVSFYNGSTLIGIADIIGGLATLVTSSLPKGKLSIRADYAGDATHAGLSSLIDLIVQRTPTTTTLSASATSVVQGNPVTLVAQVAGANPGGLVTFFAGTTLLGTAAVVNGQARLEVNYLQGGSFQQGGSVDTVLRAAYSGDASNAESVIAEGPVIRVFGSGTLIYPPIVYEGRLQVWMPTSVTVGSVIQEVETSVQGSNEYTGTFSIFDGSSFIGSFQTRVFATYGGVDFRDEFLDLPALSLGTHDLTIVYSGDSGSPAMTTTMYAPIRVKVDPTPSSISVTSSKLQTTVGSPLTLTASVTPKPLNSWQLGPYSGPSATGTVTFYSNGTAIGTTAVINGQASLLVGSLPQGANNITTSYSGDANFLPSRAPTALSMQITPLPATLTNLTTPEIAKDGALSVRVAGKTPTGLMSFYSGTTPLGTVVVMADGTATLRGVPIPVGTHAFSAVYSGDELNADGAITFTQTVTGAPSTSVLVELDVAQDRTTTQLYNRNGQLQGSLDAEGYLTEYKYNAAGEQVQTIRYATRAANFASVSTRMMAVAIARASGDLKGLRPVGTNPDDIRTYTFYNARGQIVGQVDGEGFLTETIYDARGNVAQTKRYYNPAKTPDSATATLSTIRPNLHAQDQTVTQTWSAANQLLSRTNVEGTVTSFTYDAAGRLVQTTTAAGTPDERISRARYDIQGRLIGELDGRGSDAVALADPLAKWATNGSTHTHDAAGRRTSTTDANGYRTLFFYDALSRLAYSVNALGEATENSYDALGQLREQIVYGSRINPSDLGILGTTTPGGLDTSKVMGLLAALANPAKDSHVVRKYNATGTLATNTDAMGGVTSYSYNAFREATASTQTRLNGQVVTDTITYDRRSLKTSTTEDATGVAAARSTGYDAFGRATTRIDGNGNTGSIAYDRLGRVVTTTDATGAKRITTYDAFDRVLTQRDALNNTTTYTYSLANRSVTVTTPEGVAVTTVHNRHGQTLSIVDGRQNTTTYSYDKSGNLLRTQAPEGVATSTTYDKIGLVFTSTDARGTITAYAYDAAGRLFTRTVDNVGLKLVTKYQYDATGRKIGVTDPGGTVTSYKYDLDGQVLQETVDPTGLNLQTVYTYDADGTTLTVRSPDGRLTRYTYDGAGRRIKEQVDPLGLNLTRRYDYDGQGNVVKAVDAAGNATLYIYDKANRKVFSIDAPGGVRQTSYDAEGRVSAETTYAATMPVANLNGIAPSLEAMRTTLPTLGAAATQRLRYDRDGRLRFAVDATGGVVEYKYDTGNNVIETRAYAKPIDLTTWNLNTDPVMVADDAHDARKRNVYDALGRKIYAVDGTGAVVKQVFDANGNVIQRLGYSNRVPVTTAATVAALAPAVTAVANAARDQRDVYVYDRANRQTSHTDGMGTVTTQTFDKNGNVTSRASWNARQSGVNLLTQSEFANGVSDAPARGGAVTTASMAGFAGAVSFASDPAGSYAYKRLATTAGATYTLSVIVEMEDGQPPSFGKATVNNATNSFALVMFANGANPLAYTVQNLGGGRFRISATGVAPASPGANFGVLKYAGNDARAFRVTGYQLEQASAAGSVTPTTTTPVAAAANAKKQVTRFAYDGAGRLVYTLGPLGQLEKNTYDAAGRVTLTTRYAKAINTAGSGAGPTIAQLQALVVPNTAKDQQQYSVYDKSGRLSATVDALGNVITFARDGNGNVTERTAWANPIDMTKWVPGTAPAPTADTARDQRTRMFYDAAGREALTVDALGYTVQRQYDANGRPTYVMRYPVAVPTSTANAPKAHLDAAIQFASTSGQPLQITAYGYDAGGNRTRQTQGFGQPEAATTQYVYDAIGQLTSTIDPRGVELSQSDSQWALNERLELSKGPKKYLNAAGSALKASELSLTQRQELAALYTTVNDYDAAGRKISVTDALGGVTRSEYDANGHVVKITDPLKNSAVYYFDAAGRVTLSVDPEGYATATAYDMFGQTLSVRRYFNKVAGTPSPAQTTALPEAHASDALTRFEYDAVGRLSRTIDAESNAERYTYNALGQRETLTNKLGGVTAYAYDRLGRVVSETLPITSKNAAGQAVAVVNRSTYDAFGNKATVTEAAGLPEQRVTQFKYDGLNREIEQRQAQVQIYVDGKGWSTATPTRTKTYDASGNLIGVVEPNGGRTRTWFDASNRKVAEVSATGTLSQWTYDAAGNVKVQSVYGDVLTLPAGDAPPVPVNAANVRTTTYEVDANNRVLSSTIAKVQWGHSDPDNPGYYVIGDGNLTNSSFYDANGNVVRQQNGEKVATLTWYDKLGQKVLEVDAMGYGMRWERDASGAVLRETRFAGALTAIELATTTESSLVTAVLGKFKPSAADQITEYSYDRNARVLSQARLNVAYGGVAANGALSEATASATQRTAYDAMGNKTATIDAKGQRSDMRYDALGRLLGAQRPGAVDLNGNLVRQVTDYEYDGLNNVRREIRRGTDNAVETDDQIVRYGYDATGVRTSMVTANKDKAETFTYGRDANGNTTAQMVDRLDADGNVSREIVSIAYDAANREVRRFTGTRDAANMPAFDAANTITLGYTAYGELASKRTGIGNANGQAQEYYDYDNAGRLWRTNSQDGVNKAWRYDLAGNATMLLQSQRVDLRSLSLEAMAKNGTQINPDIMVTLTAYDKDNRAVSVVQPLVNAARPNLVMYAVPVDVDAAAFGGLDITTASVMAANSAMINGPTDKSAAGQVGMLGMTFSGGGARVVTDLEIRGGRNFISHSVFGFTDVVIGSTGVDWTSQIESLYGRVTWRVEVAGNSYYLGSVATWPKTMRPMDPLNSAKRLYVPRAAVNAATSIRLIATVEGSGVEIVVANQKLGTPVENAAGIIFPAQPRETLSGTFMALTEAGVHDGDTIQLYSRARGTSGPFSQTLPVFKAGQGGSSLNNVAIDGRYLTRLDGQGSLDMLLVVTSPDGTVKRRQSFQWDAGTRQTSSSVAEAKPVFTTDNVMHFTGLTTAAGSPAMIRVTQTPVGRPDLKSQRMYSPNPAGAAGRFDVQFAAGASNVTIEMLDSNGAMMDQLIGTVDPGSSRYDMLPAGAMPSSITFRDLPAATKTLVIEYSPLDGGIAAGSVRIPIANVIKSRDGWVWDARALIPAGGARNLYQYSLRFKALDEDDFVLNDATGKAKIGAGQGTSATLTANVKHPLLTFDPGVPTGIVLKLRFREKGMTDAPFTETTATRGRVSAIFKWDTIDNHLSPDKEYEFLYDVYNAAGAIVANGEGYFRPGGNDDTNQYSRWGIPNTASGPIDPTQPESINTYWRVQRRQDYDAFGHVVKEMDGKKNITELRYNTLGLLVDKIGPSVDIRGADGQVQQNVKPTEHYSYDLNGQLVGKRDANGNQSTVEINAAGQAVVEWHPGAAAGSWTKVLKAYDVFGNLRTVTDEIGRVTNNEYDWNNRIKKVLRPVNADGTRGFDLYEYDVLGQRIAHTNAMGFKERTYYDAMGRVSQYVSAENATVQYAYTYDKTIGSAGGVNTGGWVNTTTDANGKVQTIKNDVFGRAMWKQDLGGHQFIYTYNWFGLIATQRGTSGQRIDYTYFDNGYLGKVVDAGASTESTFDYDDNGNRTFEGFKSTAGNVATVFQWSTVSYDAYNRVTKIKDDRYEINYEYDANGNRRRVLSNYFDIVGQKKDTQDYWYAYDGMNRFTTTMGQRLASGEVWRGGSGDGVTIEYDDAGQRKAATYASDGHREDYAYDGMGNLTTMKMNGVLRSRRTNDLAGRVTRYEELFADQTLNVGKDRSWNKDNQLTQEVETTFSQGGVKGSLATTTYGLMKDGTLSTTSMVTNKYDPTPGLPNNGVSITVLNTAYAYEWWDSAKQSSITVDPKSTDVKTPWAPGYSAFTYDVNGHVKTATDRNLTTPRSFSYWTNAEGLVLQRQELIGGKVDPITGAVNLGGASKSRDHRYFYFDGKRVGNVGNDGVEREDYAQQLARSATALENSDNKYRKFTPTSSADFDENYRPINAGYPGPAPGSCTVRAGDTLENIARSLWGDGQLWYLLAEANGLDGQPSAPLTPNTVLQVPNQVTNFHNTSNTFRPYDPGKAMGDTSPTLPDPLPAPKGKDGGCGGFGQILVIVVAVVATVFTAGVASVGIGSSLGSIMSAGAGVMTGGMAGGVIGGFVAGGMSTGALIGTAALAGAVGSIASQGAGIALGLQDSFSWKGVALGALGAGVTAGVGSWLGQGGGLGGMLSGNDPLRVAGRLTVGNIASQGLSVATGLQQKFSWRSVAASAVGAGVGQAIGGALRPEWGGSPLGDFAVRAVSGFAAGMTTAALRGGKVSVTQVATDAFGNALGESLAGANGQSSNDGGDALDAFLALNDNFSGVDVNGGVPMVNGRTFSQDMQARQAANNPAGLPTYVGSDDPALAYDHRNGSDIASDNYNGSRRTATVRNGQGPLAALADLGLNSAQQQAGYGYLLKTGQVQIGRNGVPMVQPGQELHIDLDDTSQAGLAGRAINRESSIRADRLAVAAQAATDSYANAEARRFANPPPSLIGGAAGDAVYGAGAGRGFINPASAGLSTAERAGLIALGGKDAAMGAIEAAGYSYGVVGTPESRAAWAIQTVDAGIAGMRKFFSDPKGSASGWWSDLNSNDPQAVREASAVGSGVVLGVGGGIVAGRLVTPGSAGTSVLRQTGAGGLAGAADEAYALIRASETDVATIAGNTGIKASNIQKVKDHVFYNEHLLDRYESLGIPGEMKRFDSNLDIANAWGRLGSGTFTEFDMQLLRHETAESWYMNKYGPSYNNSHNAAQRRYPSPLE